MKGVFSFSPFCCILRILNSKNNKPLYEASANCPFLRCFIEWSQREGTGTFLTQIQVQGNRMILYYIKEYTKYGDLYKIGVTQYDDSMSVYQNVVRRYTIYGDEIGKGLQFDLLYYEIGDSTQICKIESQIKEKFRTKTYHGTRNLIHHKSEVFIVDVLKKDKYPRLFDVQQDETYQVEQKMLEDQMLAEQRFKDRLMVLEKHSVNIDEYQQLLEHYNPLDEIMVF